jgi:hypothetical protein
MENSINGVIITTNYDTAIKSSAGMTVKQFTVVNICQLKLYYIGPALSISIYKPGTNLTSLP